MSEVYSTKINIIFYGDDTDIFLNDYNSLKLDATVNLISVEDKVIESKQVSTEEKIQVSNQISGFVVSLNHGFEEFPIALQINSNESSLFSFNIKEARILCKDTQNLDFVEKDRENIHIPELQDLEKYYHEENGEHIVYITVPIQLKLSFHFKVDGASEKYLQQKDDRKFLVLPFGKKSGYYDEDINDGYDKLIELKGEDSIFKLERYFKNTLFENFNYKDTLAFKAVNYRKNIYTGDSDKENILDGDNAFKTEIESERYFHSEYIKNILVILLESKGKNYLFLHNDNKRNEFEFGKFKEIDETIKNLDYYKNVYGEDDRDTQFIFIKYKFDGLKLTVNDIIINHK